MNESELKNTYIQLVGVERVYNGYAEIARLENISTDEAKAWAKKGGIDAYLTHKLGIKKEELTNFKSKYKNDIEDCNKVYKRFSGKKSSVSPTVFQFADFQEFYDWYTKQTNSCCYCGVNQEDILKDKQSNPNNPYKRTSRETRIASLEIERVGTSSDKNVYSAKNCRLCCYVCNNAKSDFISAIEFKPIAQGINKFWSSVLKKEIKFPTEVYETFK